MLILIAGLSWVAVTLEENEVVPQPTVVDWELIKKKKLTPAQTLGEAVFKEQCNLCHNMEQNGVLPMGWVGEVVQEYEEKNLSLENFLNGNYDQLLYFETYEMVCSTRRSPRTQEEMKNLIAFLKTLKTNTSQ